MGVRYSKSQILSTIKISDIADSYGITMTDVSSGNFTHKCKCPSPEHKSGLERTGSLYVDDLNNNFYCFGCGASNNAIDFYMLCSGDSFSEAITELSKRINPSKVRSTFRKEKQNIFPILLDISNYFREMQLGHPDDLEWLSLVMERADKHILSIGRYDTKSAEKLFLDIKKTIFKRYVKR